jgi:hypothetical protein
MVVCPDTSPSIKMFILGGLHFLIQLSQEDWDILASRPLGTLELVLGCMSTPRSLLGTKGISCLQLESNDSFRSSYVPFFKVSNVFICFQGAASSYRSYSSC